MLSEVCFLEEVATAKKVFLKKHLYHQLLRIVLTWNLPFYVVQTHFLCKFLLNVEIFFWRVTKWLVDQETNIDWFHGTMMSSA
jgi:hypothetical protein